ncbi:hypothetical protein ACFQE1_21625, partial [Halobium palmae]
MTRPLRSIPTPTTIVRRIESHVVSPLVTLALASRCHALLSRRLLLLSYEGRRSGRRFTTPTLYRPLDGRSEEGDDDGDPSHASGVALFTPAAETNWWKNFRGGHPCRVL